MCVLSLLAIHVLYTIYNIIHIVVGTYTIWIALGWHLNIKSITLWVMDLMFRYLPNAINHVGRGRGRGNGNGGAQSQCDNGGRCSGRGQSRSYEIPKAEEDDFIFDYCPNRIDTMKIINAQRKLYDYVAVRYPDVSKIFSYRTDMSIFLTRSVFRKVQTHSTLSVMCTEPLKMVIKWETEYRFNKKKLCYGILWKYFYYHCKI